MKNLIYSAAFILSTVSSALAQNVETIGTYNDWTAYSFAEKAGKVCYVASSPKKDEGNYSKRGDIFAIVTHRPAEKSFDVVSIVAGYKYNPDIKVKMSVGVENFLLFAHEDTAWANNSETDAQIVKAMIKSSRMVVRGTSSKNTETTDTYSLSGFTNAYNAINKACKR